MEYFTDAKIYEQTYEEALRKSNQLIEHVKTFKKNLEDVRTNLLENQKHLFQNIMVPIGSKALMKGNLVHTNEIFVNLGDRWFVKTSASRALEICNRMIERCNTNLKEFEQETKLLQSNLEIPQELQLFPSGDTQDILEPYDEEAEKLWKEKHRENIRKQKLLEAADRMRVPDEKLFGKLNKLEEVEAKEELAKIDLKSEQPNYIVDENNKRKNSSSSRDNDLCSKDVTALETNSKKRVSFSEVYMAQEHPASVADDYKPVIIHFKHSENKPKYENFSKTDEILSPTDIYQRFLQQFNLKSILKNKTEESTPGIMLDEFSNSNNSSSSEDADEIREMEVEAKEHKTANVVGDIVEKVPFMPVKTASEKRPLSRFKKSRTQSHQH